MTEDRNQIHYRIDTLLKYYGINDKEKLIKYLKARGQKTNRKQNHEPLIIIRYIIVYSNIA
jgi:hypothetical protein